MNNTTKELLSKNDHALQTLHNVFGMDFTKPFTTLKISGRFTVNQILKQFNADPFKIIITAYVESKYNNYLHLIQITPGGGVNIDFKTPYYDKRRGDYTISTYYAKRCFEDDRKEENATAYIIAQNKDYLITPVSVPVDFTRARFDYIENGFTHYNGVSYVNHITVKNRNASGGKLTRTLIGQTFYAGMIHHYKTNVNQLIDKSGYFIDFKQDDLKRRAAALKTEREKAAFLNSDYSDKIIELEKLINARKREIIATFENAVTSDQIKNIDHAIDNYKTGLYWIIYYFELFKNRVNNKEYSSITKAENAYNEIITMINKGA